MINKSIIIQLGLLTIILIIAFFTFTFLKNDRVENLIKKSDLKELDAQSNNVQVGGENSNKILDLAYKSNDQKGNVYEINSMSGFVDEKNENILVLDKVNAKILIFEYGAFFINSGKAKYNKLTLDTHFYDNVKLTYLNHAINSEDLFLKYIDKEVKISNNVKYNDNENFLEADEIKLDLTSKISKIYMKDKNQKVKAIIKN